MFTTATIRTHAFGVLAATIVITGISATPSMAVNNGIAALIAVTQIKSQTANEEALDGSDKQADLVKDQTKTRLSPPSRPQPTPRRR